jgi:hypothetical protein
MLRDSLTSAEVHLGASLRSETAGDEDKPRGKFASPQAQQDPLMTLNRRNSCESTQPDL